MFCFNAQLSNYYIWVNVIKYVVFFCFPFLFLVGLFLFFFLCFCYILNLKVYLLSKLINKVLCIHVYCIVQFYFRTAVHCFLSCFMSNTWYFMLHIFCWFNVMCMDKILTNCETENILKLQLSNRQQTRPRKFLWVYWAEIMASEMSLDSWLYFEERFRSLFCY